MSYSRFLEALWSEQRAAGLNDGSLADRLGISSATVSQLKSGGRAPGRRVITAVLREFPALVGYLLQQPEAFRHRRV